MLTFAIRPHLINSHNQKVLLTISIDLKNGFTIKQFIAALLVGVFTLGITPKKTLHTLLANHTDNTKKSGNEKTQQLNTAGFNCKCDDLVAESSFLAGISYLDINKTYYASFIEYNRSSFYSLSLFFFNRRGPPESFQS